MSTTLGFGLGLPVVQQVPGRAQTWEGAAGPAEIERVACAAERLGYAHIGCSDHVLVPRTRVGSMGATWYEPVATLAYLGGRTERIQLLTHVLILPYHHPLALAKSLATLDRLTRGRLLVGVGSGHAKPEFDVLGVRFAERGAMTDESIDVLRVLWTEDAPEFSGRYFRFRDVVLEPRPQQRPHPPIWVGGNTRRSVRRSVEKGDGWVPWRVEPGELASLIEHGRELLAKRGTPRPWDVVAPLPTLDLLGSVAGAPHDGAFRGSAADIAAEVDELRALGVSRVQLGFVSRSCDELVEQLEAFAREVMAIL